MSSKEIIYFTLCIFLIIICTLQASANGESDTSKDSQLFQKMFEKRRQEHKAAVQSLLEMQDYAKQYKMIQLTVDKVFQVLRASQERLRVAGYVPGEAFPQQEDIRDALSQTLETTCLLGEVVLHLPEPTHQILQQQQQQHLTLLAWGVFFTAHSAFLPPNTKKLVYLMTQELGLAEKDPNYVNPYVKAKESNGKKKQTTKKPRKRKTFKKGPSLSRQYGDL